MAVKCESADAQSSTAVYPQRGENSPGNGWSGVRSSREPRYRCGEMQSEKQRNHARSAFLSLVLVQVLVLVLVFVLVLDQQEEKVPTSAPKARQDRWVRKPKNKKKKKKR